MLGIGRHPPCTSARPDDDGVSAASLSDPDWKGSRPAPVHRDGADSYGRFVCRLSQLKSLPALDAGPPRHRRSAAYREIRLSHFPAQRSALLVFAGAEQLTQACLAPSRLTNRDTAGSWVATCFPADQGLARGCATRPRLSCSAHRNPSSSGRRGIARVPATLSTRLKGSARSAIARIHLSGPLPQKGPARPPPQKAASCSPLCSLLLVHL